jgi:hypothetical protein
LDQVDRGGPRLFSDDRKGLCRKVADDGRGARLDDAGLVPGDIGDVRPERGEMIQTDAGNDAHDGVDDIGGVEPSSRTDLHNGDINVPFGKPPIPEHAPCFGIAKWECCGLGRE